MTTVLNIKLLSAYIARRRAKLGYADYHGKSLLVGLQFAVDLKQQPHADGAPLSPPHAHVAADTAPLLHPAPVNQAVQDEGNLGAMIRFIAHRRQPKAVVGAAQR